MVESIAAMKFCIAIELINDTRDGVVTIEKTFIPVDIEFDERFPVVLPALRANKMTKKEKALDDDDRFATLQEFVDFCKTKIDSDLTAGWTRSMVLYEATIDYLLGTEYVDPCDKDDDCNDEDDQERAKKFEKFGVRRFVASSEDADDNDLGPPSGYAVIGGGCMIFMLS